jgi:pantothenate kinase type III
MILAIDAGNTRIKWGLWEDRGFVAQGSILTPRAAELPDALHMLPRAELAIG